MAASGENSDGIIRTNDRATKTLLNDLNNEESVKTAEQFSCIDQIEEPHPHSLDAEVLGEDRNGYKHHLRNLVDDTEVDSNLQHLEAVQPAEEPEDHSSYKSSMHSLFSDTVMDQHLSSMESSPYEPPTEDHSSYKPHLFNLVSDTEMDANLDCLESHRPASSSFLQTESEVDAGVDAQIQANMKISATAMAHASAASEALSMLGV